jgi:hypothetical protein
MAAQSGEQAAVLSQPVKALVLLLWILAGGSDARLGKQPAQAKISHLGQRLQRHWYQQRLSSGVRLHFFARLFNQALNIFVCQACRNNARPRFFASAKKRVPFSVNRDRYTILGSDTPARQLSRYLSGCAFNDLSPFAHRRAFGLVKL